MTEFTPWASLAGGLLIGLAVALLWVFNGRLAGISGILGDALTLQGRRSRWRWAFLAGLVAGGGLLRWAQPAAFPDGLATPLPVLAAAGLLVGLGTRIGAGCTSGHGVCGVGRLSPRSLVATATFILTGALTVYAVRHLLGGF